MGRPFSEALTGRPLFFEPVPPTARAPEERVKRQLDDVGRLLARVPRVDAVDVPELIDENHEGRPYYRSSDPRAFAHRLAESTGLEAIVNKVVAHVPVAELDTWAKESVAHGVRTAVLVGGSSRYIPYPGPPVTEAVRRLAPVLGAAGGAVGNIAIPQRTGEAHRMLQKTKAGARFFTSQIVFDAESITRLIRSYGRLCRESDTPPATVLVSLAPIADEIDAEFVRWLGADLPEAAERTILNGDESGASARSVKRSVAVWEEVLRGVVPDGREVPIGINVEQISTRHLASAGDLLAELALAVDRPTPEAAAA